MPDLLTLLTRPRSVAIVGASADGKRLTSRPQRFLEAHGFGGEIFTVNPSRTDVLGRRAYGRVTDIHEELDQAYIVTARDRVEGALVDCAAAGVRVVSILADGFGEAGGQGAVLQDRLTAIADEAGMLLVGPNSMGLVDTRSRFVCTTNAAFRTNTLAVGRTAVISQSGSVIGTILSRGGAVGRSFATFVSVGNEAQSGVGEIGQILVDDPDIDSFILFLETMRRPAAFCAFARAASARGKPIVAYVVGQSAEGRALAVSHTGAITGRADAMSAFLRAQGVFEVRTFETVLEAPAALLRQTQRQRQRKKAAVLHKANTMRPPTATVVTTTGGGGAMLVDKLASVGIELVGPSERTRQALSKHGVKVGASKLVDVTLAGANYDTMKAVVSELLSAPETGVLIAVIGSSAQFDPELAVRPIIDAADQAGPGAAEILAFPLPDAPESLALLSEGGIACFRTVESCAETAALVLHDRKPSNSNHPDPSQPEPPALEPKPPREPARLATHASSTSPPTFPVLDNHPGGVLDEVIAGQVFESLGLTRPPTVFLEADAPLPDKLPLAFPVVAKLVSPDLPHKSDVGAVRLGLFDRAELEAAIEQMHASVRQQAPGTAVRGVLVQPQVEGIGDVLLGLTRDPGVGPIVTVAPGGILAEIYEDNACAIAPVDQQIARDLIGQVKGFAALRGYRGRPAGDLDALADAIVRLSQLACHDRVVEAEINPVRVRSSGVLVLDALIRLDALPK